MVSSTESNDFVAYALESGEKKSGLYLRSVSAERW